MEEFIEKVVEALEGETIKTVEPLSNGIRVITSNGVEAILTPIHLSSGSDDEDEDDYHYTNDLEFKQALLDASGDHQKWIKIVESGIKQWKK